MLVKAQRQYENVVQRCNEFDAYVRTLPLRIRSLTFGQIIEDSVRYTGNYPASESTIQNLLEDNMRIHGEWYITV